MKRAQLSLLSLFVVLSLLFTACGKEDSLTPLKPGDLSGLGGDKWTQTAIDKWLYDSLVVPYNIGVKYKWDQFELDLNRTLVPPDEAKIVPVWRVLRDVWIKPYIAEAGLVFFNKFSPKNFIMVGSLNYNTDGSYTLGTAEGGRKIVLYGVNDFRVKGDPDYVAKNDSSFVKTFFVKTIHHEFGHILHQNILYPFAFKEINPLLYNNQNWINVTDAAAQRDGFVGNYASSAFDEDFVETLARMLVEGKGGWEALIANIPAGTSINGTSQADAQQYLREKEAIVVSYFKQVYNIDFYSLQARCRAALVKYI